MDASEDSIDRRINDFARRSFRDVGDGDYISARLLCRYGLMPQFLWSAQQAIEKYLKYVLLVNRIPAKGIRHDIEAGLQLCAELPFKIELRERSQKFLDHVAAYGEHRYLDVSYFVLGQVLVDLDVTIWDLRRYCQILDVRGKELPPEEQRLLEVATNELRDSEKHPAQHFRLRGGLLEQMLDDKDNPSRSALIWQNPCFGARARKTIKARNYASAQNAPLYLYPDMLEELQKYVLVPRKIRIAYEQHFANLKADPSKRP